jgi:hypothetical protein
MYIPNTLLDLKYQSSCFAPVGQYRVVWMDTLTYEFGVSGEFNTLELAQKAAEEVSGPLVGSNGSGQTVNKAYIFNDRGKVAGEAGGW